MSVLAVPLSLGDGPGRVEDVEALVRKVVDDRLRQWGARLKELDYEDLVSYLIGVCWELSGRYDIQKDGSRPNFGSYAARILSLRVADWYRQRFGDTRHGEKPIVLSLDAPASHDGHTHTAETSGPDRLVDTLPSSTGDPALDRTPDLVGVLKRGSGSQPEAHDAVGEPASRRAARGNRRPAAVKAHVQPRVPKTLRASGRPPLCEACLKTFLHAFTKVNKKRPDSLKLTAEDLMQKASIRAQAVRVGPEWFCPRCTVLENEHGHQLLLSEAYPNRAHRRAAAKQARSKRK